MPELRDIITINGIQRNNMIITGMCAQKWLLEPLADAPVERGWTVRSATSSRPLAKLESAEGASAYFGATGVGRTRFRSNRHRYLPARRRDEVVQL